MPAPYDAVLLVAFGGPDRMSDVRPFLANVLRGRRVPPERVEEVERLCRGNEQQARVFDPAFGLPVQR